jgi:hypothetical protein
VDRLLQARFIQPCCYPDWVYNIIPVEKKNTGKIRICVDFRNLNRATPKDEYPMPVADLLIDRVSGNKVISFLDGNAGYNQIFKAKEDVSKTLFRCLGFVGLYEWVIMTFGLKNAGAMYHRAMNKVISFLDGNAGYNQIFKAKEDVSKTLFRCLGFVGLFVWVIMTFGLKNAGATYHRAMNLIFHHLLRVLMEVYIDDVVVKSVGFEEHMTDLKLLLERMKKYELRMNPLKCSFGVTLGRFLGFIVHEHGIQIDPKRIESIGKIGEPVCKKGIQKLLGKMNYLRHFISNLAGRVESLLPLVRLIHEDEFIWGAEQQEAFEKIKEYLRSPPVLRAQKNRNPFKMYIAAQEHVIGAVLL